MIFAAIADDFTGGTGLAGMLHTYGTRTVLVSRDVAVAPADAIRMFVDALTRLRAHHPRQVRDGDIVWVARTGQSLRHTSIKSLAAIDSGGVSMNANGSSKEFFFHLAATARALVHLHSAWSALLSCVDDLDERQPLSVVTPYCGMREAVDRAEELEETCKFSVLSHNEKLRLLTAKQRDEINQVFGGK